MALPRTRLLTLVVSQMRFLYASRCVARIADTDLEKSAASSFEINLAATEHSVRLVGETVADDVEVDNAFWMIGKLEEKTTVLSSVLLSWSRDLRVAPSRTVLNVEKRVEYKGRES
ncbi:hypothetical protein BU16DRAFT_310702 [Lophium mytilinum]|uniref:Uncharacterized protein n=1 Tax=Lophium mytilinum TaxID=390894 RepID=A0A6A6QYF6_9PEZI|nr:hypothetical protein BU16DRAFT_310702 [Lophium mytilinum]